MPYTENSGGEYDLEDNHSEKKTEDQIRTWRDQSREMMDILDQAVFDGDDRLEESRYHASQTYNTLDDLLDKMLVSRRKAPKTANPRA